MISLGLGLELSTILAVMMLCVILATQVVRTSSTLVYHPIVMFCSDRTHTYVAYCRWVFQKPHDCHVCMTKTPPQNHAVSEGNLPHIVHCIHGMHLHTENKR